MILGAPAIFGASSSTSVSSLGDAVSTSVSSTLDSSGGSSSGIGITVWKIKHKGDLCNFLSFILKDKYIGIPFQFPSFRSFSFSDADHSQFSYTFQALPPWSYARFSMKIHANDRIATTRVRALHRLNLLFCTLHNKSFLSTQTQNSSLLNQKQRNTRRKLILK